MQSKQDNEILGIALSKRYTNYIEKTKGYNNFDGWKLQKPDACKNILYMHKVSLTIVYSDPKDI